MSQRKQRKLLLAANRIEMASLLEEIAETKMLLGRAYSDFNNTSDHELIEACVFEINSLHSRYSFLIRKVKENRIAQSNELRLTRRKKTVNAPKGDTA